MLIKLSTSHFQNKIACFYLQVTPRQRQEIYALNRVMTRLENDRFKKFCQEKGFKGDLQVEDYDIFM